jgi:hypothetical protein
MKNEETNNSLNNPDNYKKQIDCSIGVIIEKYSTLMIEYYKTIHPIVHLKNNTYSKYIIIRGLDTLTNVFLNILSSTKNEELTYFYCQKAFYFYIEFIDQISDDEKTFLQLTSRDATTYVYKKTIFEICQEHKKSNDAEHNEKCKKIGDANGFCGVWCIWWVYQRLLNRDINLYLLPAQLIKIIKLENLSFKSIIRNFSKKITNLRDVYLSKYHLDINDWIVSNYVTDILNNLEKDILNNII